MRPDVPASSRAPAHSNPAARPRRSAESWLIRIVLLGALAVAVAFVIRDRRGAQPVEWEKRFEAAKASAAQSGRPLLLEFTADWCPSCVEYKAQVAENPPLAAARSERFVPVKVDLTDRYSPDNRIAERYEVSTIPALIVLAPDGRTLGRYDGAIEPGEILHWLHEVSPRGRGADSTDHALDTPAAPRG